MAKPPDLQELETLANRFKRSFTNAAIPIPTDSEIAGALGSLKKIVGDSRLYSEISQAMSQEKVILSPQLADSLIALVAEASAAVSADPGKQRVLAYQPNQIPAKDRWSNFIFASALLAYGGIGARIDDLYIPGRRGNGVHLHGAPVWVMFGAMACAALVLLLTIVDHYDRRDNERHYQQAAAGFKTAGWTLFGLAFLVDMISQFLS